MAKLQIRQLLMIKFSLDFPKGGLWEKRKEEKDSSSLYHSYRDQKN